MLARRPEAERVEVASHWNIPAVDDLVAAGCEVHLNLSPVVVRDG